jgi:glycosyltransferase involved in cell wall biosynthesis
MGPGKLSGDGLTIMFDCRYVRFPRHDGISRYSAELVSALGKIASVTMIIHDERQLEMLPDLPWVKTTPPTAATEMIVARTLNGYEPDVVYTVMQTMGPFLRKYKLVNTVHDLIYYSHRTPPRNQPGIIRLVWRLYHLAWWPQRILLGRADATVAVSQTTRALISENHLTPRPTAVVYNATDRHESTGRTRPDGADLVYMGGFIPYKNVDTLARGMALLDGYRLHIMSGIESADRERLTKLAPEGSLVFHDGASDEEYFALLNSAVALVTASRDEGFGLPLVEAMGVGTPVVASDIPVFREIGADAVVFFPSDDATAFAAGVRSLEDPDEWARRSQLSIAAADPFRWENSAKRLLAFLTEVAAR